MTARVGPAQGRRERGRFGGGCYSPGPSRSWVTNSWRGPGGTGLKRAAGDGRAPALPGVPARQQPLRDVLNASRSPPPHSLGRERCSTTDVPGDSAPGTRSRSPPALALSAPLQNTEHLLIPLTSQRKKTWEKGSRDRPTSRRSLHSHYTTR